MAKTAHSTPEPAMMGHRHAGAWAIAAGYPVRSLLAEVASAEVPKTWKRQAKAALSLPAYANLDGSMVSTMDQNVEDMIREGAVAIIPIKGMMMREAPDWYAYYGITSTERITNAIIKATADARVKGIVITGYSYGGQVAGCERLADAVKAAKVVKPVIGHTEMAYSAAYWGMANCTTVMLDGKTASTGSIGVMTTLEEYDAEFLRATFGINRVDINADGSEEKNLAEAEALAGKDQRIKDEQLNPLRAAFVAAVQEGRPGLVITKTNDPIGGRTYTGQEAVDVGLADGFATLAECIELARGTTSTSTDNNINAMSKFAQAAKAVKEFFAFAKPTTEPNAEQLAEANAALKAEGLEGAVIVAASEYGTLKATAENTATATAEAATAKAELAKAQAAQATAEARAAALENTLNGVVVANKLAAKEGQSVADVVVEALNSAQATATATNEMLAKAITENAIEVPADKTAAQVVVEKLAEWGGKAGASHTGGQRQEDPKTDPADEYPSLKAAHAAGISVGAAK